MKYYLLILLLISFYSTAITYKYDSANRVTEATYKDGTVVSYTFDQNGNLLSITPNGSSSGGDDSGGSDTGGDTGGTDTPPSETPAPTNNESSGGALGGLTFLIASILFAIRARVKVKLER